MTRYVAHMVLMCAFVTHHTSPPRGLNAPLAMERLGKAIDLGNCLDSATNHLCDLGKAAPLL